MQEEIIVSKRSPILLYGAASIGSLMYDRLTDAGYTVIGFLDKRGDEIGRFCGLPVWTPDTLPDKLKKDETLVVFFSVKNVFEHDAIARFLTKAGLKRLIFKPRGVLVHAPAPWETQMDAAYTSLFDGEWRDELPVPLPRLYDLYGRDNALIDETNETVTAWIPVDFVFTNDYHDSGMEKWGNLNILTLFTHLEFFRFLAGDPNADYHSYLREYCEYTAKLGGRIEITNAWRQNVLRNRAEIYKEMCLSLELDPAFFHRNAPEAEWSERGYFNLTSGKHRASFLASKGHWAIPLRVSKKDYRDFLNLTEVQTVRECLSDCARPDMPVPHPYFYRAPGLGPLGYYGALAAVLGVLSKEHFAKTGRANLRGCSVLLDIRDNGAVGAFFARLGCRVYGVGRQSELSRAVMALGHMKDRVEWIGTAEDGVYDFAITDAQSEGFAQMRKAACEHCFVLCHGDGMAESAAQRLSQGQILYRTIDENGMLALYYSKTVLSGRRNDG